jgi:hypothetical protein
MHGAFSRSQIGFSGASAIAEALSTDTCLQHLDLSYNPLGIAGLKIVLSCLKLSTLHISSIDLRGTAHFEAVGSHHIPLGISKELEDQLIEAEAKKASSIAKGNSAAPNKRTSERKSASKMETAKSTSKKSGKKRKVKEAQKTRLWSKNDLKTLLLQTSPTHSKRMSHNVDGHLSSISNLIAAASGRTLIELQSTASSDKAVSQGQRDVQKLPSEVNGYRKTNNMQEIDIKL